MKIKVSNTTPNQINWLVAKCLGFNAEALVQLAKKAPGKDYGCFLTKYSTNWSFGGPIIERECIELHTYSANDDGVVTWRANDYMDGHTPLIAAMRCFVVSKLGDEVEVPEELK